MEKNNLQIALQQGVITQDAYNSITEYKQRLNDNNVPVIYNLRHLRKIFRIKKREQDIFFGENKSSLYRSFSIPKKSGGVRQIEAPCKRLKEIQRWIKDEIVDKFVVSEYATGFRKNMSIVDNARKHVGKELVINMDIKDFFPSVTYADILLMFMYIGYRKDVAHLLTKLCTNAENVLPQGSPASPSISNHILLKLDKRLGRLAESVGADYSRYADDITFSGKRGISTIIPLVEQIIEEEGFLVNENKTRLQYNNQRQEVTGLIVNNKIAVSSMIEDEIRNAIYFIKKYEQLSIGDKRARVIAWCENHNPILTESHYSPYIHLRNKGNPCSLLAYSVLNGVDISSIALLKHDAMNELNHLLLLAENNVDYLEFVFQNLFLCGFCFEEDEYHLFLKRTFLIIDSINAME